MRHSLMTRAGSLRENRFHATIAFTVLILAIIAVIGSMQALGASGTNSGALKGNDSITSMVQQVRGWNGTTWVSATMTLTPASDQVAAAFPTGFSVKNIWVVTDNSSYNVQHLLGNSLIFTTSKITITVSGGGAATLNSAYAYLGTFSNSSAASAFGDEIVTHSALNQTLYAGSTNNLGTPVEYNLFSMFATPGYAVPIYGINLAHVSINKTQALTLTFVNYLSYPFSFNLIVIVGGAMLAISLANIWFVYNSIPEHTRD
jgi:hypothetical protein